MVKLLYGEIPKDTFQNEVYYYWMRYFQTLNQDVQNLPTKIVGKIMMTDKTNELFELVFSES
jgi:hypothetical protein